MSAWPPVRLDQCTEVISGATPDTSEARYWDGDICWVTPKDLSNLEGGYISGTSRKISHEGLKSCAATILPPESVLFSSRAPIGHVAINTVPMATNQGFKSFVPDRNRVHPKFLYHWLKKNRSYLESLGNGATFKEVSKALVSRIEIPLPALPEQRRIAAILDKADELRAKSRAAIAKLDSLTQSIFLDMFGDPATNPKGWPSQRLGECANKFSDGPFGSNLKSSHYTQTGIRVVRLQNIGVNAFLNADAAYISEHHFAKLKKHECLPGDVLVGTLGEPNLRACIQPNWLSVALNKADCVQIRPDARMATSEFLCALLNQPSTARMAQDLMHGQTRVRISMGRLRNLSVPIPPIGLQRKFATRVSSVETLKGKQGTFLSKLNDLFSTVQHRAFRGEL